MIHDVNFTNHYSPKVCRCGSSHRAAIVSSKPGQPSEVMWYADGKRVRGTTETLGLVLEVTV